MERRVFKADRRGAEARDGGDYNRHSEAVRAVRDCDGQGADTAVSGPRCAGPLVGVSAQTAGHASLPTCCSTSEILTRGPREEAPPSEAREPPRAPESRPVGAL